MEDWSLREIANTDGHGYDSQWTLMNDLSAWLDLRLYFFYAHHQWLGPRNDMKNMLGLVVTREEFEHNLAKASQRGLETQLSEEEFSRLLLAETAIRDRLGHTETDFPLTLLFRRCALDEFEQRCVVLAYLAASDRKYEKLFAYLQDDITQKAPGTDLAVQLFMPRSAAAEEYLFRFSRRDIFTQLFDTEHLSAGQLVLQPLTLEFLSTGTVSSGCGLELFDGSRERPQEPLAVDTVQARRLDALYAQPGGQIICLTGGSGRGKRFQIRHLMARQKRKCVFAQLNGKNPAKSASQAALLARLTDACLCFSHMEIRGPDGEETLPDESILREIVEVCPTGEKVFFLSHLPLRLPTDRLVVELELPPLSESERVMLFRTYLGHMPLGDGLTLEELGAKFRFSPRQICDACRQAADLARMDGEAEISGELMHRSCCRQAVHKLGSLATPVRPAFGWDDVVMPQDRKRLLQQACAHIRYQHRVFTEWGFDKKITYGRGLSILFAGSPGTGKTMCAQVMANALHMELYKINISQIVSKYIGETEKNLQAVFAEARHANCILFFDECDAIFGKRSEVKDAHDRNANVEVAYLLQQIEEHDGVCIMATNLIGNIDAAFMRRITYVVHFPFPDAAARQEIYRRTFPAAVPLASDIDWAFLAEKFPLSGGHIKNIVLSAAFLAAQENEPVGMRQLLRAAVGELKKNEIVVVREDLREYADLLDDAEQEEEL